MTRDFRTGVAGWKRPQWRKAFAALGKGKDLRLRVRVALGSLLAANLIVGAAVLKLWTSSAEELERQLGALRQEVVARRQGIARLRAVVSKVETARQEAEQFVANYFLERRTVSSVILSELDKLAKQAGVRQKEGSYLFEPVEGSNGLSMMTIHAGYEGTYAELVQFLNLLDRSPRLLIVSDLQAAPQATGQALNITMKLNAFVRDAGGSAPAEPMRAAAAEGMRP